MLFIFYSHLHVSSVLPVAAVGSKYPLDLTGSFLEEHGRLVVDVAESWPHRRDSFDVCVPVAPEL